MGKKSVKRARRAGKRSGNGGCEKEDIEKIR